MAPTDLARVADLLIRRARREGSLRPQDVRAELARAGLPPEHAEDFAALASPALVFHKGRYYPAEGPCKAPERQRERIGQAVERLIRAYQQETTPRERRRQDRLAFTRPVEVWAEDDRELTLLSRDLSLTGIRLISPRSLLGQKVHVLLPSGSGAEPSRFLAQIVWSCAVGESLFENGAIFLDAFRAAADRLRVVGEDGETSPS